MVTTLETLYQDREVVTTLETLYQDRNSWPDNVQEQAFTLDKSEYFGMRKLPPHIGQIQIPREHLQKPSQDRFSRVITSALFAILFDDLHNLNNLISFDQS